MKRHIWLPSGCLLGLHMVRTSSGWTFYHTVCTNICWYILRSITTGVCNTDNFSLLSITIDFGPFGFMESYNPSVYDDACLCFTEITEHPCSCRMSNKAVMLQILSPTHLMMRADTASELRPTSDCSIWRSSWWHSVLCFLTNSRKSKKGT